MIESKEYNNEPEGTQKEDNGTTEYDGTDDEGNNTQVDNNIPGNEEENGTTKSHDTGDLTLGMNIGQSTEKNSTPEKGDQN